MMSDDIAIEDLVTSDKPPQEFLDKQRELFKAQIDEILANLKYSWHYHGQFDDPESEGFSDRLADRMIGLLCKIPKGWGYWISCGPGWYRLLASCDEQLEAICPGYEVHQIKEKFGTLRYYVGGGKPIEGIDPEIVKDIAHTIIARYEYMSSWICEQCGNRGKIRGGGWIYTACDKHAKEEDKEEDDET